MVLIVGKQVQIFKMQREDEANLEHLEEDKKAIGHEDNDNNKNPLI